MEEEYLNITRKRFNKYLEKKENQIYRMKLQGEQALQIKANIVHTLELSDTELRIANSNKRIKLGYDPVYAKLSGRWRYRDDMIYRKREGGREYPGYFWEALQVYREMMGKRSMKADLYESIKKDTIKTMVNRAFEMFKPKLEKMAKYSGRTLESYII